MKLGLCTHLALRSNMPNVGEWTVPVPCAGSEARSELPSMPPRLRVHVCMYLGAPKRLLVHHAVAVKVPVSFTCDPLTRLYKVTYQSGRAHVRLPWSPSEWLFWLASL